MNKKSVTILDGGMGRELERKGAPFKQPQWSATALLESPGIVKEVHKDFINSGAQVITTSNYAVVPFHIGEDEFRKMSERMSEQAGKMARQAVEESDKEILVAGSIPPLFGSYRPDLFNRERVEEIATPIIKGLSPYADFWLCETQSLIEEPLTVKNIIDKIDGNKPVWVSFTLKDEILTDIPRLRSGEPVAIAIKAMTSINVEAVLFNCCQPESIRDAIEVTSDTLKKTGKKNIRIGAYANAFPPQEENASANSTLNIIRPDITPDTYLEQAKEWNENGATILGGCCGIGPEHIEALAREFGH